MEVRRGDETYFHLTTEQVRRYNLLCIYKGIFYWSRAPPACQFDWSFIFPGSGLIYIKYYVVVVYQILKIGRQLLLKLGDN